VDQLDNVGGDMNLMLMMMDQSIMNTSSNLRSSLKYNDHRDANRNAPKSVLIQNIIHDLVEELTAIIDSDSKIQLNYQQLGSIDLTSIMSNTSVVNLQHASVGNPHSSIGSLLNPQPSFSGLFTSGSNSNTSGLIGSNSGLIGNMMMTGSASLTTNLKEHEQDKYTNIYFNNSYSLKLLFKYHNDPTTKSYIYREILKRMQDHEDNITILLYCLQLLKTILTTFKRDDKLLDHYKNIYYYCKDVLSRKHVNANLQSQVQFIIKYIYRHLIKILQRNQLYIMNMLNYDKRISGLTSRIFEYYLYKNRLFNNEILKLYQQESNTVRRQLSTLENNPTSYSTNNSIMDFIYFGSQFRKFTKFEDKQAEIDLSNKILNIENMDTIKHQIESIQNEINPYASSPIIHDLLLPNISQYIDQYYEYKDNNNRYIQSIVENDEQFNTILNQIIIGCNNDDDDTKLNDASLLFVMMISNTIYGSESTNRLTMKQLNSFFMEMLDSNNSTSIFNAFKILFNIYHYNLKLYEQYQNISSIELVLSDLFIKFCDMVTTFHMMMMDDDSIYEQIRLITSEILVYFLYHHFIIYNTAPSTRNILIIELNPQLLVDQLDIRVVYDMILFHLNHIDESQDAHFDLLIALLCFQINQNMKLLDKLPNGVTSLIDIYTIYNHVLNMNSKYNLFLILFDHVIDRNLPSIDPIQRDLLFLLFDKSNIPIYCHYLFKYLPTIDKQNTFIRQLSKFLYVDFVMKNDHIIPYIKNNLDMECMMKFLIGLQRLSCNYLENQFKPYVNHLLSNTSPSNLNIMDTLLKDLLFDLNDEQNRRQGEHLLFNIVKFNEDFVIENIINTSNYYSNLRNKMNQLLNDMIQHENEQIRMIYLNILEKKILLLKSKCTTHGDSERVKSMIKTLNESLLECIVNRKETNSLNLIKAFHLVFDFISICTFPSNQCHVFSTRSGMRLLPPMILDSKVEHLNCTGNYLVVYTLELMFYLWDMKKLTCLVRASVDSLLSNSGLLSEDDQSRVVDDVAVTPTGVGIVTLMNGESYAFDRNLQTWVCVADSHSVFSPFLSQGIATQSLETDSDSDDDSDVTLKMLRRKAAKALKKFKLNNPELASQATSETVNMDTIDDLEVAMTSAAAIGDKDTYIYCVKAYVKHLAKQPKDNRLKDLFNFLLGPVTISPFSSKHLINTPSQQDWEPFIAGIPKRAVLKELIVLLSTSSFDVNIQRICKEYGDIITNLAI